MEDSWELVSVPSEIQHSTISKEAPEDGSETPNENNEGSNKSKVNSFKLSSRLSFNESWNVCADNREHAN